MRRIGGIVEAQVHGLIADELHRGRNDGVKDVLKRCPLGQRALDAGKLIEQGVAIAKHLPQPSAFLVIALGASPSAITPQQPDARLGVDDCGCDHLCDRPVVVAERRPRGSLEAQGALLRERRPPAGSTMQGPTNGVDAASLGCRCC